MPRVDTNRSLPLTYRAGPPPEPGSTPEQIVRAVWEELSRITTALSDYDRPVSLSVFGPDTIGVYTGAPVFDRQLNNAPTILWQKPGATFDAQGRWTAAQEGLYLINGATVSNPFAAPATKSYSVLCNVVKFPADGGAQVTYSFAGGGLDDQNVTCNFSLLLPLVKGDRIALNAAAKHPTVAGSNTATSYLNITRQSGLGNNAD